MQTDRVLHTKQIAAKLGCSSKTVLRLYKAGSLPGAFKVAGRGSPLKMSEADLQKYIRYRGGHA
jgi:predicted DNA-binding transcriptional regulator AlpA